MFTPDQTAKLDVRLDPNDVKTRKGPGGKTLSYVSGDYIIEMANAIFGFGNWDAETVEMKREHEPVQIPPTEEYPKGSVVVTYSARVRVTVWSPDHTKKITRERCGAHRGFATTVGEAIENCIKSAETDATKRAFVTFGNQFGLALYDKSHKNVGRDEQPARRRLSRGYERPITPIAEGFDGEQAARPTTSERALAVAARPAQANGHMRY